MKKEKSHLYAKDSEKLQIPYSEYQGLMDSVEEARRLNGIKTNVLANLKSFLNGGRVATDKPVAVAPEKPKPSEQSASKESRKVSVEFSAEKPEQGGAEEQKDAKDPAPAAPAAPEASTQIRSAELPADVPPIKNDICEHFNKVDVSGRLFNVFKQYYTCMNEACGGTVRVTIKDGFCSLWNYDEWEEFAFIDIFDNHLRIAIDPRYTDKLKSLKLCEVPRLLSSRHNLICVQVDDLNNTVLDVLSKAFREAGKVTR